MKSNRIRTHLMPVIAVLSLLDSGCHGTPREIQMSPEAQQRAIRLLGDAYAAFNRGDIPDAIASLDPQIEWIEPQEFPGGGTYHGRAGVMNYLTQSRAAWGEVSSEPERFIVSGDRIVVFVHARVRPKDSSEWREARLADVYTYKGGTPIAMRAFANREEALRWAGAADGDT
jgi:uncharacterized protein